MKKIDILKKAVDRAVKNGYKNLSSNKEARDQWLDISFRKNSWFMLIFSHEFAIAFWGEKIECLVCGENHLIHDKIYGDGDKVPYHRRTPEWAPAWEYHIQEMVLYKDPLKYLKKFI